MNQAYRSDVLVIGAGAAAVRAAIEASRFGTSVILVDKGRIERSGTSPLGLHGMACTLCPEASEDSLVSDTVSAGCDVNDVDLVRAAASLSSDEVTVLESMGVRFARRPNGVYDFYIGTGHTQPYGLTLDEELCGINFVSILSKQAWKQGVKLVEDTMVTDLLVHDGRVGGAVGVDRAGNIRIFRCNAVVLAAGGANALYPNTTLRISNPMYRTCGDAFAMALRAGLSLVDMEFANFRETPPAARIGKYVNRLGDAFMCKYDPRGERATRGKLVEALYLETQAGRGPIVVRLNDDVREAVRFLPEEYKAYVRQALEGDAPEVTISFQRLLGGVRIMPDASTAIQGLFAAGESAGGFHGADRLQGMAFLETQVFGKIAGRSAAEWSRQRPRGIPESLVQEHVQSLNLRLRLGDGDTTASAVIAGVRSLTNDYVSIVRNGPGLEQALARLGEMLEQATRAQSSYAFESLEAENLALAALAAVTSALNRRESRGTHHRSDYPDLDAEMARKHVSVQIGAGGMYATVVPSRI